MQGYYKDEEKTAEVIQNGYFHTGDIGKIDAEGFLKITDRKKQLFKTSGGKYIAPQLIENKMKQIFIVNQILSFFNILYKLSEYVFMASLFV
jgi:long-chain acyl-CoA synthetase